MDRILSETAIEKITNVISYIYSFQPLAEKTTFLVPGFVTTQVESLSEAIGFDIETLRYTLGIFLCYPLGVIMLMLPHGKVKHLFSFLLGAFLLQFTIGVQWIHHLITSLVAYIFFIILPAKTNATVVPVFVMTYITLGHLHRQFINYLGWDLDFTGSQMVLTMKLYSLAFNIFDGQELAKGSENRASKKCASLAVDKVPGIIEYLGYTFNFSTILCGPAYEYKIYADACDGSNLYDKNGKPRGKIPSSLVPTLIPFVTSLVCLVMFVVGNGKFPLLDPSDPQNITPVILTPDFLTKPWLHRAGYTYLALFFVRQKYYFAWKNSEGANNIWYAGFEGFDKDGNALGWEHSNNVDIMDFETAPNLKTLTAAWNKKTANWLGRYVYMRTNGSLVLTYGLSAFWHGFYPGYYLFFLTVPLLTFCERLGRKKLSPRFGNGKKWSPYGILAILATAASAEYCVVAFQMLSWDWAIAAWKSHYFSGHIAFVLFYIVLSNIPTPKDKKL